MQDAVQATGVSVGSGARNQEALFANPFKDSQEEALVIDAGNRLTYLERTDASDTGWLQEQVGAADSRFTEVVVVVHPNGSVWALCVPERTSGAPLAPVQGFMLSRADTRPDGTADCVWMPLAATPTPWCAESLTLSYSPDAGPVIGGNGDPGAVGGIVITALSTRLPPTGSSPNLISVPFDISVQNTPLSTSGQVVGAGFQPFTRLDPAGRLYVFYVLDDKVLARYTVYSDGQVGYIQISTSVKQFAGAWYSPNLPQSAPQGDVGYCYLDAGNGDLVCGYVALMGPGSVPYDVRESALGFETAGLWQDADGKLHIYGENADGALQVLHQSGWTSKDLGAIHAPPTLPAWTSATPANPNLPGIGGYDLAVPQDRVFAFDYTGSGLADHLVCYRPRADMPTVWVLKKKPDGTFAKVFDSTVQHFDYPLSDGDLMFPVDFTGTGRLDHLVAYRPGTGRVSVLAPVTSGPNAGSIGAVFAAATGGIGGYDLAQQVDRMFAFDYTGNGHADHLVAYRPGGRTVWILERTADPTSPYRAVYASQTRGAGDGIGSWTMDNPTDQMFAFDHTGNGHPDHLVAYRPFSAAVHIIEQTRPNVFTSILQSVTGIGGYPMNDPGDRLMAFGYGDPKVTVNKPDHLVAYRVPTSSASPVGIVWVLRKQPQKDPAKPPVYAAVFASGDPVAQVSGDGIGGWDLSSANDQFTVYDDTGSGRADHLLCYRPGAGLATILAGRGDLFLPVYQAPGGPVTVTVGLQANISSFQLDPYPDYKPSQIVRFSGATDAEAYCLSTQDVTTSGWATDKIRLPYDATQAPDLVSHYVAGVTLLDTAGNPMPLRNVSVSADSLVEVQVGAVSYQVGPGRSITAATDGRGALAISIAARGLSAPIVYLNTDGLDSGAAVDFAAPVNDYLAGTGSLPSQKGTFDAESLSTAQCVGPDGTKTDLVPDWDKAPIDAQTTVDHCTRMYGMAAGTDEPLTARIEGFDEPQPIAGYVIQKWDSSRPSYQVFRTEEELAAYRAYRDAHPAYGGWWEDFTGWASDVWEGVKSGVVAVAEVIVETFVEIAVWVGDAVVSLGKMIISAIEQAVQAVEAVFQMIAEAVMRVIDWLKALFAFGDIWNTKLALETGLGTLLDYGAATVTHVKGQAHGWFQQQEAAVTALFDSLKAQYGTTRLGDVKNQAPSAKDPAGNSVSQDNLERNPQATWMMDRVGVQAVRHPELFAAGGLSTDSPLPDALTTFLDAIANSGLGTTLSNAAEDLLNLLGPSDPNGTDSTGLVALFDLLEQLVLGLLEVMDAISQAAFTMTETVLANADDLLNAPLDLGFVSTLYKWIQTSNGISQPEELTVQHLFCLILAFFGTTLYKLVQGVDNPPFAGGFPTIPAPPWHQDYDPAHVVGGNPAENKALAGLQAFCGFMGIVGGISQAVTDILDVFDADTGNVVGWVGSVINVGATFFFTVLTALPPVTGTGWEDAGGQFSTVFATTVIYLAAQIATIYYNRNHPTDDPNLKNQRDNLGSVVVSVLSWIMLGLTANASVKTNVNLYTTLQGTLAFVPGSLAFIRVGRELPYYQARSIAMCAIDALGNIGPAVMMMVASLNSLPGPTVTVKDAKIDDFGNYKLGTAQVGMAFTGQVSAWGANEVWNTPAQHFQWATDHNWSSTPPGLSIDDATGLISGAPQVVHTYGSDTTNGFGVMCTDSFGPPQYSRPIRLALDVTATPIKAMAVISPANDAQQDYYINTDNNPYGSNSPLTVHVTDENGKGLPGALVQFTFPTEGQPAVATATFADGTSVAAVVTDSNGDASVPGFSTNAVVGTYQLTAAIPGVTFANAPITFALRNVASPVTHLVLGSTSTPQETVGASRREPGREFPYELTATAYDASNKPVPNIKVVFERPADQPGITAGRFVATSDPTITAYTDANGNVNAGKYTAAGSNDYVVEKVTASVPGTSVSGVFQLKILKP